MRVLASVDLPEPFGPIRAWVSPFFTTRSTPCRISRSSVRTCRFWISRVMRLESPPRGCQPRALMSMFGVRPLLTDRLDQVRERHVGQGSDDGPLNAGPQQLGG